jgi:hypothetical protein
LGWALKSPVGQAFEVPVGQGAWLAERSAFTLETYQ